MKTYLKLIGESFLGAVIYCFWFDDKLKAFIDGLSIIFIIFLVIGGVMFLERGGYFDVFGYTFTKTASIFNRKQPTTEVEQNPKMKNLFNYQQAAKEKRISKDNRFLVVAAVLGIVATVLSLAFY